MSADRVGVFEVHSDAWYGARATRIGGSEIAAILGLSKWESRFSLWHRKRGMIPPQPVNPGMDWGTRLEPVILDRFDEDHPDLTIERAPGTWVNGDRPWQLANPDAIAWTDTDSNEIVEVKTDHDGWDWGTPGTNEIPPYYLVQCRWYLDTLGWDTCHVPVLIGGSDYREYVVHPNPDDTQLMREAAEQFMASLDGGDRPNIDDHDATYQAIKQIPAGVVADGVEIPPDLAEFYIDAHTAHKAAERTKREAASLVLDAIGDRTHATCDGRRVATRAITKDGRTHSLRPQRAHTPKETP